MPFYGYFEFNIDHMENKKRGPGHNANLKILGCKTMGCLTIGFNGENYIYPSEEFKIQDGHLKRGKYVLWG